MTGRVRALVFGARSALPASAACMVANGVRETLGALLGAPVALRLFEPAIPSAPAWGAILRGAQLYRVRGNLTDAAIVLRAADALALSAALFGESHDAYAQRELSRLERDLLDRTAGAIAAHLGSVCGTRDGNRAERIAELGGFSTYFELSIEEPLEARIGIAVAREPAAQPRSCIEPAHLAAVPLALRVTLDAGRVAGSAVARLRVGTLVPLGMHELQRCALSACGRTIARGGCGVRNGRFALHVATLREGL